MMTIFSIPKPFLGHIGVIQRNAIRSWLALSPKCEVVLVGDGEGVASSAHDFGVRHLQGVARNEFGTPLLDDAFARVTEMARFPRLCYVNADIILPAAFTRCTQRVALRKFLMVGQRATIQVDADLDFADPSCDGALEAAVAETGSLDAPLGSDYFVFPKDVLGPLPPFAVGRPGWDNWMIYRARELRVPVVDASEAVLVIHQDHSYAHVPSPAGDRWEGPEAEKNRSIVNPTALRFTTRYATWRLTTSGLTRRRWWSRRDRFDAFEAAKMLHPRARPLLSAASVLMRRWDRRFVAWLAGLARANGRTGG